MTDLEENIKRVSSKLKQLLKQYQTLQKENERLKIVAKEAREKSVAGEQQIELLNEQVLILKSAAMQLSDADKKELEKRINQYIREVDKCINFLSE